MTILYWLDWWECSRVSYGLPPNVDQVFALAEVIVIFCMARSLLVLEAWMNIAGSDVQRQREKAYASSLQVRHKFFDTKVTTDIAQLNLISQTLWAVAIALTRPPLSFSTSASSPRHHSAIPVTPYYQLTAHLVLVPFLQAG